MSKLKQSKVYSQIKKSKFLKLLKKTYCFTLDYLKLKSTVRTSVCRTCSRVWLTKCSTANLHLIVLGCLLQLKKKNYKKIKLKTFFAQNMLHSKKKLFECRSSKQQTILFL